MTVKAKYNNGTGPTRYAKPRSRPLGTRMVFEILRVMDYGLKVSPNSKVWFDNTGRIPKRGELVVAELVNTEEGFYDETPEDYNYDPSRDGLTYIGGLWRVVEEEESIQEDNNV